MKKRGEKEAVNLNDGIFLFSYVHLGWEKANIKSEIELELSERHQIRSLIKHLKILLNSSKGHRQVHRKSNRFRGSTVALNLGRLGSLDRQGENRNGISRKMRRLFCKDQQNFEKEGLSTRTVNEQTPDQRRWEVQKLS